MNVRREHPCFGTSAIPSWHRRLHCEDVVDGDVCDCQVAGTHDRIVDGSRASCVDVSLGRTKTTRAGATTFGGVHRRKVRRVPTFGVALDMLKKSLSHCLGPVVLEHLERDLRLERHPVRLEANPIEGCLGNRKRRSFGGDADGRDAVHDSCDLVVMVIGDHSTSGHCTAHAGKTSDQLVLQVDGNERRTVGSVVRIGGTDFDVVAKLPKKSSAGVVAHCLE